MITHLNEKLIAVEVPSDAERFKISNIRRIMLKYFTKSISTKIKWQDVYLPEGTWKILGEVDADNISFDVEPYLKVRDWRKIVSNGTKLYFDYLFKIFVFKNKRESFRSLLQSKGIDTNKPNVKHVILEKV